jgi:hypothetical protein
MSSRLTFITTNLVFGVALLSALLLKNSLLEYAVIGFVWFMLLCYLMLLISPPKNKIYVSPVPSWVMYSIDFIFLFALLISRWYVTASAYGVSCVVIMLVYSRRHL